MTYETQRRFALGGLGALAIPVGLAGAFMIESNPDVQAQASDTSFVPGLGEADALAIGYLAIALVGVYLLQASIRNKYTLP